jgi:hypothetical protein
LDNIPTPTTGSTGNILSGSTDQSRAGKANAIAQPEPQTTPGNNLRKARVKEDVDPDYAEEAEDFFYGEGM